MQGFFIGLRVCWKWLRVSFFWRVLGVVLTTFCIVGLFGVHKFVEMHVFMRIGQDDQVASWTPSQSNKPPGWVGLPRFYGSGSTVVQGQRLRCVIVE